MRSACAALRRNSSRWTQSRTSAADSVTSSMAATRNAAASSAPLSRAFSLHQTRRSLPDPQPSFSSLLSPLPLSRSLHTARTPSLSSVPTSSATSSPAVSNPAALLKDDYGVIDTSGLQRWICPSFTMESGETLTAVPVCYQAYGQLNAARDNVIVVCHALTGHAALHDWWGSLLGPGLAFDTSRYLVLCANLLGSCYGTAGPTETDPRTGRPYGADFPVATVRDSVALHRRLVFEHLQARKVCCAIGGSLGGMQALEWGFSGAAAVQSLVALACNAKHSAWQIAINHTQRQAIYADPLWQGGRYSASAPPAAGLSVARQFAMITYRTQPVYQSKFGRSVTAAPSAQHAAQLSPAFEVERYLMYQGSKLLSRFDANSYVRLTQQLDSHDVGRGRSGEKAALAQLQQPVLVMGVDSDVLYPMHEQQELAAMIPHSSFVPIRSLEGHDGFLLEQEQIGAQISTFLSVHGVPDSERRTEQQQQQQEHQPQQSTATHRARL